MDCGIKTLGDEKMFSMQTGVDFSAVDAVGTVLPRFSRMFIEVQTKWKT